MKRIIIEEPTPIYDEKGSIKYYQDDEYIYIPHKSKKQEWSEEDIDASVKSYSDSLPMCGEFQSYHDALVHAYRQGMVNALKSLRPSWKPNEVCYGAKGDPDPVGVWKPSEEQMTNLLRAEGRLRIEGENVLASKLAELYEQLKKLIDK